MPSPKKSSFKSINNKNKNLELNFLIKIKY